MPLRILIADDHSIFRQGVKALLEREGFIVTGEVADGHAVIQMAAQQSPDVVVLDLAMPVLNGLDAAREITRAAPRTRIILLTMHTEDPYVARALKVGIRGYVLKSQAAEDLVQAIREVARGAIYLSPGVSEGVLHSLGAMVQTILDAGGQNAGHRFASGRLEALMNHVATERERQAVIFTAPPCAQVGAKLQPLFFIGQLAFVND